MFLQAHAAHTVADRPPQHVVQEVGLMAAGRAFRVSRARLPEVVSRVRLARPARLCLRLVSVDSVMPLLGVQRL